MRIAYVNQDPGIAPGRKKGAAVHVAALQAAFAQLGCEVVALETKDDAATRAALAAAHEIAGIDAVYERYALNATAGADFARACDVPLLLEVNAPLLDEAREQRGFDARPADIERERAVFAAAHSVFCVSRGVADYVASRRISAERLVVIANGVDVDVFRPEAAARCAIDLPRGAFVLGFHGRLRPWHNLALLGAVVERLLAGGYPAHVLAVGEGDFASALPAAVRASHSTFLPWLPPAELAPCVARFDALPLTYASGRECYFSPLKLLEAMACGVVPLVPDLGDLPEAVDHGRAGVVYPAGDAVALADAIAGLIDWPHARQRIADAAVARARRHTWTAVAERVLARVPEKRAR